MLFTLNKMSLFIMTILSIIPLAYPLTKEYDLSKIANPTETVVIDYLTSYQKEQLSDESKRFCEAKTFEEVNNAIEDATGCLARNIHPSTTFLNASNKLKLTFYNFAKRAYQIGKELVPNSKEPKAKDWKSVPAKDKKDRIRNGWNDYYYSIKWRSYGILVLLKHIENRLTDSKQKKEILDWINELNAATKE